MKNLTRRHAQVQPICKSPIISETIQIFIPKHIYSYILWHKVSSNIDQEVPQVCPHMPHLLYFIKGLSILEIA